ncbi:MAG: hypothetical protein NZZ41_02480 [Candidatus Dojkabacteria bacterium]|nr:hypothetical protein [Candidatus Dojkabacteria bacterium]
MLFFLLFSSTVVFGVLFVLRSNELDRLNIVYKEAQQSLNADKQASETTIADLKQSFVELNKQVQVLRNENDRLVQELKEIKKFEKGRITGSIIAFIPTTGENKYGQFQLVCAENVTNTNVRYCVSLSAIEQHFTLDVPFGKYYVTSTLMYQNGTFSDKKAFYTEYVKCVQEKKTNVCDQSLSEKLVEITLDSNTKSANASPIDIKF